MTGELCIIGGGGIGGLIAYYAYRSGYTDIVVYYGSRRSVEAVNAERGLLIEAGGRVYYVPVLARHYTSPGERCRVVFNAVKAYNVSGTIPLMERILEPDGTVFMLQNGFGSCEEASRRLGYNRVLCSVVFIGGERVGANRIRHNGGNTIITGSLTGFNQRAVEIAARMRMGGLDLRITENILFYRWLKLGVNAVINPVTAILRAPNRVVLTWEGRRIAELIAEEVVEAARRNGVELDKHRLLEIIFRVARNTGDNYSSMAQDVLRGRRTEIDYINGFIARILGWRSIDGFITMLVHMLEEQRNI